MNNSVVYHFSCTARLPWILQSGELRAGADRIGGYPFDFLWATISEHGSRSSSAGMQMQGYRDGLTRLVRFTLPADDFEPWPEITRRYPAWTPDQIARLERTGKEPPMLWRCRTEPLPRTRWIAIDTKSYLENQWRSLSLLTEPLRFDQGRLGVAIAGRVYISRQYNSGPGQPVGYAVWCMDEAKLEALQARGSHLRSQERP